MSDGTQPNGSEQYPPPPSYPPPASEPAYPPPPAPPAPDQPAAPPTQPPQQPAPSAQPPQQAAPAPGYESPTGQPAAPAPKKRSPWTAVGIGCGVLAVFALCAAVGIGTYFAGGGGGKSERKAAFERAETHYTKAGESLGGLEAATKKLEGSKDPGEMAKAYTTSVSPIIDTAATELTAARREVEPLESSEARTAYLGGLDAADAALVQFTAMGRELSDIGKLSHQLEKVSSLTSSAGTSLDKAIKAADKGRWNTSITLARKAESQYEEAEKLLKSIENEYPSLGFEGITREVTLRKKACGLLIDACQAGKRGASGAYGSAIDKFNAIAGKTGKADTPDVLNDPSLLLEQLTASYKTVVQKLTAADELHAKAVAAIDAGNY